MTYLIVPQQHELVSPFKINFSFLYIEKLSDASGMPCKFESLCSEQEAFLSYYSMFRRTCQSFFKIPEK